MHARKQFHSVNQNGEEQPCQIVNEELCNQPLKRRSSFSLKKRQCFWGQGW